MDFTVAVVPTRQDLVNEMKHIKSALLYADKINLISPLAYAFILLADEKHSKDERAALNLIKQSLPIIQAVDTSVYDDYLLKLKDFEIVNDKRYKNSTPFSKRYKQRIILQNMASQIRTDFMAKMGETQSNELNILIKKGKVTIESFDSLRFDQDAHIYEYLNKLKSSLISSYPLFDKTSNDLIESAVKNHIVTLSEINKRQLKYAGTTDNLIQRLPSFEQAPVDEILDIKDELSAPLSRFRAKMFSYSDSINSLPWNDDFATECTMLYDKEIAPTLLEIQETIRENSFAKNLGRKFLTDKDAWKSIGGFAVSIAAPGVLSTFVETASANIPTFLAGGVAGGGILAGRVYSAYENYLKGKKEVEKNDLFFYYKAGERLGKI